MAAPRTTKMGPDILNTGSWDDVPEQMGSRREMYQPGPYRFKLPPLAVLKEAIEEITAKIGDKEGQTRIAAIFRDQAALTVIQSPRGERNGETFSTRITNAERRRGKKDDPKAPWASDMDYLLQKLGWPKRPQTNQEYTDALLACAEKEFAADIELGASCNDKKHIRVRYEGEDQLVTLDGQEGREEQFGCGTRYYQGKGDLPKDETGKYERSMECQCGAVLYMNENLVNFRS